MKNNVIYIYIDVNERKNSVMILNEIENNEKLFVDIK